MVVITVVVAILLSTLMSIIETLSTITIKIKEIPRTVLITMSIKGISTLLVKGVHVLQHHKVVADQVLQVPTGRQQDLQHHQGEPKVELQHLIDPQHLIELRRARQHLIEPQVELQAGHQHHRQIDRHHQIDLLPQIDHHHHHALRAQADRAEVAEEVEDDKIFLSYTI